MKPLLKVLRVIARVMRVIRVKRVNRLIRVIRIIRLISFHDLFIVFGNIYQVTLVSNRRLIMYLGVICGNRANILSVIEVCDGF